MCIAKSGRAKARLIGYDCFVPSFCTKGQSGQRTSKNQMTWTKLQFEREEVNAAAKAFLAYDAPPEFDFELYDPAKYQAYSDALPVINNWRSSHGFPLNTFRRNLNIAGRRVDPQCILAQRIKRLSSISLKLRRFPNMKLSQMQDIGGCRAVVRSIDAISELVDIYRKGDLKHKLMHTDDYVKEPQMTGYRGVHLIYRYYSDRNKAYNGLKIELQFRTNLQHAWATAVETVGTFLQQALKSSLGEAAWLRFFALMGTALAIKEKTPPVPGTPVSYDALVSELHDYAQSLDVENRLRAFGQALQVLEQPGKDAALFLLQIDPAASKVMVTGFRRDELDRAASEYLEAEKTVKERSQTDAVLVSVESLSALRRAYPNYFADTHIFMELLKQTLEQAKPRRPSAGRGKPQPQ